MRDEQLLEVIERYLNGEMNADERMAFEQLRSLDGGRQARRFNARIQHGAQISLRGRCWAPQ